jgi:hypothetical protein
VTARRALASLVLVAGLLCTAPRPASAQDGDATTTTASAVAPQEIIPQPNSGTPPQEAGDRGGALQLGLLALVVAAIGGGVLVVVRQSRRARGSD